MTVKREGFSNLHPEKQTFQKCIFYYPFPVSPASRGMCLNWRQMQAYTLHSSLMDGLEDLKVHSLPLQMSKCEDRTWPLLTLVSESTGVHEYEVRCPSCWAFHRGHHPGDLERQDTTLKDWLNHGKTPKNWDRDCAIFCHSQFQTTTITGNNRPQRAHCPQPHLVTTFSDPCKPGQGQVEPMQLLI